jgi:TatA/E family protein of Tat protein translocase
MPASQGMKARLARQRRILTMLSFPHLVVLFVIALIIFGPQKLPELARMLGKATAEFRKMTNDFRFALEDEVREIERQTRIREEEAAAAARVAQAPAPTAEAAAPVPEGAVPRELPPASAPPEQGGSVPQARDQTGEAGSSQPPAAEAVSVPQEKPADDHTPV